MANPSELREKDVPILIHELYNHFKQISQDDDDKNNEFNFEEMIGIPLDTSVLNCLFTNDEIKKFIIKLKNGKSEGADVCMYVCMFIL